MSRNPYAPPTAPVNEIIQEPPPLTRPWQVTWAVRFGVLSLMVGMPELLLDVLAEDPEAPVDGVYRAIMLGFMAAIVGLIVLLLFMISRGRNWARIVYTVLAVLGVILTAFDVPDSFALAWYYGVLYLLSILLDVATVVLLFVPVTNAWFRLTGARRPG